MALSRRARQEVLAILRPLEARVAVLEAAVAKKATKSDPSPEKTDAKKKK